MLYHWSDRKLYQVGAKLTIESKICLLAMDYKLCHPKASNLGEFLTANNFQSVPLLKQQNFQVDPSRDVIIDTSRHAKWSPIQIPVKKNPSILANSSGSSKIFRGSI